MSLKTLFLSVSLLFYSGMSFSSEAVLREDEKQESSSLEEKHENLLLSLPQEIINMIFSHLKVEELIHFRETHRDTESYLINTKKIDLSSYSERITDEVLEKIVTLFPCLVCLDLGGCNQITDKGIIEYVCKLSQLHTLSLAGCEKMTVISIEHVSTLTHLHILDLRIFNLITDDGLTYLGNLNQLKELYLVKDIESQITDAGLSLIKGKVLMHM